MIGGARDKSFNFYFTFCHKFLLLLRHIRINLKSVAEVQPNINPATSCNAEHVFNLDGLIITKFAQHLTLK